MADSSRVLSINVGSSSVKFSVFSRATLERELNGAIDRIGMDGTELMVVVAGAETRTPVPHGADHVALIVETLAAHIPSGTLAAIGHRVVHGGGVFTTPTKVDAHVLSELKRLIPFAPRHLPLELASIEAFLTAYPDVPHYACFDTQFHTALPSLAQILPIPRVYRAKGIRRYGFHGLSYEHAYATLAAHDPALAQKKIIIAHLGSGASVTAIEGGVSVDTSMGLTPASGIPMGTRSGDIDPGIFEYLTQTEGVSPEKVSHMMNYESGMLGVSGMTADMEVLIKEAAGNPAAEEAVSYFAYRVRKEIGALAAAMDGLDALVFTGGIGEKSAGMRARICHGLTSFGVTLDETANDSGEMRISHASSDLPVYVIPADEELVIARHVAVCL